MSLNPDVWNVILQRYQKTQDHKFNTRSRTCTLHLSISSLSVSLFSSIGILPHDRIVWRQFLTGNNKCRIVEQRKVKREVYSAVVDDNISNDRYDILLSTEEEKEASHLSSFAF